MTKTGCRPATATAVQELTEAHDHVAGLKQDLANRLDWITLQTIVGCEDEWQKEQAG